MFENRLYVTFHALADPTRRGMLASLALGEKSIGELAEPFSMTLAGASKQAGFGSGRNSGPDVSIASRP